jgi:PAS domain-containing protein
VTHRMPQSDPERWADLRRRAEAALDRDETEEGPVAGVEARRLIQERCVAQTELELQNEELRRAQHSLIQSRNRDETLFLAAPVGNVVLDRVGLIRQVNESSCQMLGRPAENLLNRPLRSIDRPLRQYLAQIETAAVRSATLVQQLLAFAHKSVVVPRVLDPRDAIGDQGSIRVRCFNAEPDEAARRASPRRWPAPTWRSR